MMGNALLNLANHYARKRNYADAREVATFVRAFMAGWNEHNGPMPSAPDKLSTEWPNAYGAGYWEGNHAKEKALLQ